MSRDCALLADLSTTEGLTERTGYFAQPWQSAERESPSAVVFRVGAEWLGISTGVVYQVALPARIREAVPIGAAVEVLPPARIASRLVALVEARPQ